MFVKFRSLRQERADLLPTVQEYPWGLAVLNMGLFLQLCRRHLIRCEGLDAPDTRWARHVEPALKALSVADDVLWKHLLEREPTNTNGQLDVVYALILMLDPILRVEVPRRQAAAHYRALHIT